MTKIWMVQYYLGMQMSIENYDWGFVIIEIDIELIYFLTIITSSHESY